MCERWEMERKERNTRRKRENWERQRVRARERDRGREEKERYRRRKYINSNVSHFRTSIILQFKIKYFLEKWFSLSHRPLTLWNMTWILVLVFTNIWGFPTYLSTQSTLHQVTSVIGTYVTIYNSWYNLSKNIKIWLLGTLECESNPEYVSMRG